MASLTKELNESGLYISNEMEEMIRRCSQDDRILAEWFRLHHKSPLHFKLRRKYPPTIIRLAYLQEI